MAVQPASDGSFRLMHPTEKGMRFCIPERDGGRAVSGQARLWKVRVCMKFSNKDARAQSACNLLLNGVRFATPQVSGTGGKSVTRDMGAVLLEAGIYELTLQNTKMPGMEVEWVEFTPESL